MTFPKVIYITQEEDFFVAHDNDVDALTQGETTMVARYTLNDVKIGKLVPEFSHE